MSARGASAEQLRLAIMLRDDWLRVGLSTGPADVETAEAVVTELYGLIGKPRPDFEGGVSPAAALPAAASGRDGFSPGRLRAATAPATGRDWPTAARLASLMSDLRGRLDTRIGRATDSAWLHAEWPAALADVPEDALLAGAFLGDVLGSAVGQCLRATLRDAVCGPVRTALPGTARDSAGLAWYGQQDAWWAGHYDVWRRVGLVTYRAADDRELDLWAALARSAGWWWPGDRRCVMAARPTVLRTEPAPFGPAGQLRLHAADGPAVRFADGHQLHVLHGTPVPAWVINDPTVERIHAEPNVEIRRSAIERMGWEAYIDQAGLALLAGRADPGNPGSDLRLYDVPVDVWGSPARVLLAVNGSAEPDGRRRQYALSVPAIDDPVAAAAWTYGLTKEQYAQLARRT